MSVSEVRVGKICLGAAVLASGAAGLIFLSTGNTPTGLRAMTFAASPERAEPVGLGELQQGIDEHFGGTWVAGLAECSVDSANEERSAFDFAAPVELCQLIVTGDADAVFSARSMSFATAPSVQQARDLLEHLGSSDDARPYEVLLEESGQDSIVMVGRGGGVAGDLVGLLRRGDGTLVVTRQPPSADTPDVGQATRTAELLRDFAK